MRLNPDAVTLAVTGTLSMADSLRPTMELWATTGTVTRAVVSCERLPTSHIAKEASRDSKNAV